jgi:hypothetical protein
MVPSFLIWGAGQFYEDRTSIGGVRIVAWLVSGVLTILTAGLFGIVAVLLWARTPWTRTPNWSTCTTDRTAAPAQTSGTSPPNASMSAGTTSKRSPTTP